MTGKVLAWGDTIAVLETLGEIGSRSEPDLVHYLIDCQMVL